MLVDVSASLEIADIVFQDGVFFMWQAPCKEPLPDVINCLLGRMTHVFCIEAVVSKFVHDYFVCREVVYGMLVSERSYEFVNAEQQGRLAELVAVSPVLEMPYRTDREDELFFGTELNDS